MQFLLKTLGSAGLFLLCCSPALSQFRVNPQVAISLLNLEDDRYRDVGDNLYESEFSAEIGFMAGVDTRIGRQFYFQPGIFYARNISVFKLKESVLSAQDSLWSVSYLNDKLIRTSVRLKSLLGFDLVHRKLFKCRLLAGPTYDFILDVVNEKEEISFSKKDFNAGSFNLDAGLGLDLAFLTLEAGMSYGLTHAFKKNEKYDYDSRYSAFYVSMGIVFGKEKKEKKKEDSNER
ncbi:MAG: outer membrane beta-barrel protein [Bacteroidia bacterium]|nr:outer membrane beta-barrel protein [Bacteroidia bacterium]